MYLTTKLFCICTYRPDLEPGMLSPFIICQFVAFGNLDPYAITGPCWDPYWVVSVLSPILFILLIVKAILMIIKDELFRKFFVIHILAVIVSSYCMYPLSVFCGILCNVYVLHIYAIYM